MNRRLEQLLAPLVEDPKLAAGLVGLGTYDLLDPLDSFLASKTIMAAYGTYLGVGYLRQWNIDHGFEKQPFYGGLVDKIKRFVFRHTQPLAILGGAAVTAYLVHTTNDDVLWRENIPYTLHEYALYHALPRLTAIAHIGLRLYQHHDMIQQSLHNMKDRLSQRSTVEKVWNIPYDHSALVGTLAGVWKSIEAYHPVDNVLTLASVGFNVSMGMFGFAAAGGVLHTESLRYYYHHLLSQGYRVLGKTGKAVTHQEHVLTLPSSQMRTIEGKLDLAHRLLEDGREEEALVVYHDASLLYREGERGVLSGPDVLRKMLFMGPVHLDRRFQDVAPESVNEVVEHRLSRRSHRILLNKRGLDHDHIVREYKVNRTLKDILGRECTRPSVPVSVACFEGGDGNMYHTMLRHHAVSLDTLYLPEDDSGLCEAVMRDIATLHRVVTPHLQEHGGQYYLPSVEGGTLEVSSRDYGDLFNQRVFHGRERDRHPRLFQSDPSESLSPAVRAFSDDVHDVIGVLDDYSSFFVHGDLAPRHVMDDGMMLDFEHGGAGNPLIDVAQFCFEGNLDPRPLFPIYVDTLGGFPRVEEQLKAAMIYVGFTTTSTSASRISDNTTAWKFKGDLLSTLTLLDIFELPHLKEQFIAALHKSVLWQSSLLSLPRYLDKMLA
jgi:hypothetical protein